MKDSEHFGKSNFPFLCLRQSRVLVVHLFLFADALLCKLGVWDPFRTLDAVTLLTQICIFPIFLVLFFQKFNLNLSGHIHKISFSI